jgi:hypothetical protein
LEQDSTGCASDDDEGGGGLRDLRDASAFDHHPSEDAEDGDDNSTDAGDVHCEWSLFGLGLEAGGKLMCIVRCFRVERGSRIGPCGAENAAAVVERALCEFVAGFADN